VSDYVHVPYAAEKEAARWLAARGERGAFVTRRMDLMESPVERRFASVLKQVGQILFDDAEPWLALIAQCDFGWCRPDFVVCARPMIDRLPCRGMLLIEIDGHDFHEKSRDQVEADKRRDRRWAREGVVTLRFTGREINRRPCECATEVLEMVAVSDYQPGWGALRGQVQCYADSLGYDTPPDVEPVTREGMRLATGEDEELAP
jgi:hypothetical protein